MKRKSAKQKPKKPKRLRVAVFVAALLCAAALRVSFTWVRCADLFMNDLPRSCDGVRMLYIADIPENKAGLLSQLAGLKPDYVLLGSGLPDRDNVFYAELAQYFPNVPVYAAPGDDDVRGSYAGVTMLVNNFAYVETEGRRVAVVGLDAWNSGDRKIGQIAKQFSEKDFVIVMTSDAESFAALNGTDCRDGNRWADIVLAPRTGKTRYPSGWTTENGGTLLVSKGVSAPLDAEVHLLTLHGKG